jgi:hypothetical protein
MSETTEIERRTGYNTKKELEKQKENSWKIRTKKYSKNRRESCGKKQTNRKTEI